MKHICHLVTHLRLGAGRYVVDLAVEQLRRGDFVSVCLSDDAEGNRKSDSSMVAELRNAGVGVVTIGDMFHRDVEALHVASLHLRDYAFGFGERTVVHSHMAMGIVVAKDAGASTVVSTCHGWNPSRPAYQNVQDASAFTMANGVTSPSAYLAERVSRMAGINNVSVLPYGFDLRRYPELDPVSRRGTLALGDGIVRRWGKPSSCLTKRIICLAELTTQNGQDVLISAMPRVWETYPDVELYLAGDGDQREPLRAQARAIDPDERRIIFRGSIEKPYGMLHHFDLMCLPSRVDDQPVSIVEAMLAGLPVVSTTVGGIPEQIALGSGGVCVLPDDVDALASALVSQLEQPGRHNRNDIRQIFDIRNHVSDVYCWYESAGRIAPKFPFPPAWQLNVATAPSGASVRQ